MNAEIVVFFILSLAAIGSGVMMLNSTKVVYMMVSVVFTFLSIAGLFLLLSAEFVAGVQVLIYSGAVTIIMMFGIMLTKHDDEAPSKIGKLRLSLVLASVAGFFVAVYFGIKDLNLGEQATDLHVNNTEQIGISLYSNYVIPFELTSVLLLVALVGAIILAKRDDEEEAKEK